jgi:WD40 repeat protein
LGSLSKVGCVAAALAGCSSPTTGPGSQVVGTDPAGAGRAVQGAGSPTQGAAIAAQGASVAVRGAGVAAQGAAIAAQGAAIAAQGGVQGEVQGSSDPVSAAVSYNSLSYSSKADVLAVAGSGGVMLFDATTGAKRKTVDPGRGYASQVAQGTGVLATSLLGDLWLLDPAGAEMHHLQLLNQVYTLALSSDESVVVSGGIDGAVHRFQTADGLEVGPALLPVSQDFVNQVQISPDGLYVAAATSEGAHVWSTADGTLVADIAGRAATLAFAPDSHTLAVGTDAAVELHALPDGHTLATYPSAVALAYATDGSKLALSPDGMSVTVLDATSGTTLATLVDDSPLRQPEPPQTREVAGLAFVGGDSRVAVAWRGGRLTEWQLSDATLVFSRLDADLP